MLLVTRCAERGSLQEACALELKSQGGLPWGAALCPLPCEACTQGLPRPRSHHVARLGVPCLMCKRAQWGPAPRAWPLLLQRCVIRPPAPSTRGVG